MNGTILITGCGRSGTSYIVLLLKMLGLRAVHEGKSKKWPRNDGLWFHSSWYEAVRCKDYPIVLHQVRNPLKVVASCKFIPEKSYTWPVKRSVLEKHFGVTLVESNTVRNRYQNAMLWWTYWQRLIEPYEMFFYKIEDIDSEIWRILDAAGISRSKDVVENALRSISRNVNNKNRIPPQLTWSFLKKKFPEQFDLFAEAAQKYGYPVLL